jgi:hypothetical protein
VRRAAFVEHAQKPIISAILLAPPAREVTAAAKIGCHLEPLSGVYALLDATGSGRVSA